MAEDEKLTETKDIGSFHYACKPIKIQMLT